MRVLAIVLSLAAMVLAQDDTSQVPIQYDLAHNATVLFGTWSSGAGLVQTGPKFCDPKNKTFNPPRVAGISYAFDPSGHFEQVEYRFGSNPAKPACPNATLLFQHGKYSLFPNGSIILDPIASDGMVQTQSPCMSKSSSIQQFSTQVLFKEWRIFYDPPSQGYHLHLFRFDGAPLNKMILRSEQAIMHPTTTLVGEPTAPVRRRSVHARSSAPVQAPVSHAVLPAALALALGVAAVTLL